MKATLRGILQELKLIQVNKTPVRTSPMYVYLMEQYKAHQTTGNIFCKEKSEMNYLADTYLCLLENTRKLNELQAKYSREELTVEKSANLVGLTLPKNE